MKTLETGERSTGPKTPEGKTKAAQNANKGLGWVGMRRIAKALHGNQTSQDELSTENCDSMAETVVAAALDGHYWAIQKIAEAIDDQVEV
jgi:hypothetical protein